MATEKEISQFKEEIERIKHAHITIDTRLSCRYCHKIFGGKNVKRCLIMHIQRHMGITRRYTCKVCNFKFLQKCHLEEHMLCHTGIKPHRCQECDRAFRSKANLLKHMKVHGQFYLSGVISKSTLKCYRCDDCEKECNDYQELLNHDCHSGELNKTSEFENGDNIILKRVSAIHSDSTQNELEQNKANNDSMGPKSALSIGPGRSSRDTLNKNRKKGKASKKINSQSKIKVVFRKQKMKKKTVAHVAKKLHACTCGKCEENHSFSLKTLSCEVCGIEFWYKCNLNQHKLVHRNQNCRCSICKDSFANELNLKYHMHHHGVCSNSKETECTNKEGRYSEFVRDNCRGKKDKIKIKHEAIAFNDGPLKAARDDEIMIDSTEEKSVGKNDLLSSVPSVFKGLMDLQIRKEELVLTVKGYKINVPREIYLSQTPKDVLHGHPLKENDEFSSNYCGMEAQYVTITIIGQKIVIDLECQNNTSDANTLPDNEDKGIQTFGETDIHGIDAPCVEATEVNLCTGKSLDVGTDDEIVEENTKKNTTSQKSMDSDSNNESLEKEHVDKRPISEEDVINSDTDNKLLEKPTQVNTTVEGNVSLNIDNSGLLTVPASKSNLMQENEDLNTNSNELLTVFAMTRDVIQGNDVLNTEKNSEPVSKSNALQENEVLNTDNSEFLTIIAKKRDVIQENEVLGIDNSEILTVPASKSNIIKENEILNTDNSELLSVFITNRDLIQGNEVSNSENIDSLTVFASKSNLMQENEGLNTDNNEFLTMPANRSDSIDSMQESSSFDYDNKEHAGSLAGEITTAEVHSPGYESGSGSGNRKTPSTSSKDRFENDVTIHKKDGAIFFTCKKCDVTYVDQSSMKEHLRSSEHNTFSCHTCGNVYNSFGSFSRHLRTHTGEKPYQCEICGKAFVCKAGLRNHKFSHTSSKPHMCKVCGRGFTNTGALHEHSRIHTGEKIHQCEMCGLAFTHRASLKRHISSHTGQRPYECDKCGKTFIEAHALKRHSASHSGVRPYKCNDCGKSFTANSAVLRHKRKSCKERLDGLRLGSLDKVSMFKRLEENVNKLFDSSHKRLEEGSTSSSFLGIDFSSLTKDGATFIEGTLGGKSSESLDDGDLLSGTIHNANSMCYQDENICSVNTETDVCEDETFVDLNMEPNVFQCARCSVNFLDLESSMNHTCWRNSKQV